MPGKCRCCSVHPADGEQSFPKSRDSHGRGGSWSFSVSHGLRLRIRSQSRCETSLEGLGDARRTSALPVWGTGWKALLSCGQRTLGKRAA